MNALQLILRYLTAPFRFLLQGPTYLIGAPRRIFGMSPPARAATLLAIALILCTLVVVVVFTVRKDVVHADILRDPKWIAAVVAVIIATPITTYFLVRLWLEGDASLYPDIDRAWDEGLAALSEQGLTLVDLPLYLILGTPNDAACDSLLAAGRVATIVPGSPRGSAPLRWYASQEAIYLALTGTGRAGRLSQFATAAAPSGRSAPGAGGGVTATMVVGPGQLPSDSTAPAGGGAILGTLVAGGPQESTAGPAPSSSSGLSLKEAEQQTERLAYVCRRLRRARQPYCANNGILAVIPHAVLDDIVFARDLPEAVRADLDVVADATQLNSSVAVLVTGMEVEAGFSELVRRVGLDRAANSRFGKGFNVWNAASDENMDALSSHACGSFEDWVHTLFAREDGAEERSNGRLFAMLCRVRRHLQPKLRGALVNGFAADAGSNAAPRLLSGCYFAATGRQPDQQAFVRSVFDKLDQQSEDLQWSDAALREESMYRWLSWLLTLVNGVMLIAVGYLAYRCFAQLMT